MRVARQGCIFRIRRCGFRQFAGIEDGGDVDVDKELVAVVEQAFPDGDVF